MEKRKVVEGLKICFSLDSMLRVVCVVRHMKTLSGWHFLVAAKEKW